VATQQHAKIARVRKRGLSLSLSEDANVLSARKQTNSTKKETYLGWNNCRGKRSRQHFDETLLYSSARKLCGSSNFSIQRDGFSHTWVSDYTPDPKLREKKKKKAQKRAKITEARRRRRRDHTTHKKDERRRKRRQRDHDIVHRENIDKSKTGDEKYRAYKVDFRVESRFGDDTRIRKGIDSIDLQRTRFEGRENDKRVFDWGRARGAFGTIGAEEIYIIERERWKSSGE